MCMIGEFLIKFHFVLCVGVKSSDFDKFDKDEKKTEVSYQLKKRQTLCYLPFSDRNSM